MKRLLLLGGGHAQVQVVNAFAADPPADTHVVLINRTRFTPYSGMLPGLIAGHYTYEECHIDLAWLCARAGIGFIEQEAVGLDPVKRLVHLADGRSEAYDLLSIDTGSAPPLDAVPGASRHALAVKPMEHFLPRAAALMEDCARPGERHVALVGGGAAGFEVTLALAYRHERTADKRSVAVFHWLTDTDDVLPTFPPRVRRSAAAIMARRGVHVHTGARVERVDAGALQLRAARRIEVSHVVWATGAAPASMFAAAGLATDERGFIAVDATLRSISHPDVFASGDVASVREHPRPKAGVFAVRQGPPLARNLRLALAGRDPRPFVPQKRFLVILSTGERCAIATKGPFAVEGRWVWTWKDRIDRRFMARFQPPR